MHARTFTMLGATFGAGVLALGVGAARAEATTATTAAAVAAVAAIQIEGPVGAASTEDPWAKVVAATARPLGQAQPVPVPWGRGQAPPGQDRVACDLGPDELIRRRTRPVPIQVATLPR